MAAITLRNVFKIFEKTTVAVDDFSLEIADKEFVVLVGPSGCGKSTTLRMIAGLEEISAGELLFDGKRMNDVEPKNRNIAMVFQTYALYPHMTVYDNIAFGLKMRKTPRREIDRKVREAAEILEIGNLLKRKPQALSGGQRQRVAIGRAIVRNPDVFLMDEPLSNLDAKLRSQMRAELIKLRRRLNTTFVYVTHDQTEAMTLGDRIVIMLDGRIMQVGTPTEVFEQPANKFVAGFIGTPQMNFIPAVLHCDGDMLYASFENIRLPLPCRDPKAVDGRAVVLGIRPEHVQIVPEDGQETTVEVCELMGSSLGLHLKLGTIPLIAVATTDTVGLPPRGNYEGHTVRISFRTDKMHIFDAETEERISLTEDLSAR